MTILLLEISRGSFFSHYTDVVSGWVLAYPVFGSSVNPIPNRRGEADYAHHITPTHYCLLTRIWKSNNISALYDVSTSYERKRKNWKPLTNSILRSSLYEINWSWKICEKLPYIFLYLAADQLSQELLLGTYLHIQSTRFQARLSAAKWTG